VRITILNNEGKPGKVLDAFHQIPVIVLIPFILCILVISLFKRAEFCIYKYGDKPGWMKEDPVSLILTVMILLLLFILVYKLGKFLDKLSRRQALFTVLYISAIIQVLVILYLPAIQFADQNAVNQIAMRVLEGNFADFRHKGYLNRYPNNIGITIFLTMIYKVFPNSLLVPKLLNVVLSSITSYLMFRIYEEADFTKYNKGYGILIFAGFFPPMLLLNNLVYNDIIATTFFVWSVFNAIRYVKTRKWQQLVYAGALIIAGDFFRQVGILILLSITLYFIIKKVHIVKTLIFIGAIFVLCKFPLFVLNNYLLDTGKIGEPIGKNAIPVHMWLHMGMNERSMGYWDNFYSYNVYIKEGNWNKEKSTELYTDMIKKNVEENGIAGLAELYLKKNIWLWTEGTYQAEYYGIGSWGYLYPTFFTSLLDNNQSVRDIVRWILHASNILMLGLVCIGLIHSVVKKYKYPFILSAIVLLGFIGFYTLWEIKPRYIYVTYPYLILMSYYGLNIVMNKLSKLIKRTADQSS
jgi:hypothetical protein